MAQTRRQIEAWLNGAGIRPLKRFGQNFLIEGNLIRKLVQAAEIRPDDVVLEVGPGTGTLTEDLLAAAGHVVAVEIDKGLAGICRERFGEDERFTLLHTDVLERKSRIAPAVLEAVRERQQQLGGRMMLVANLPYQAATPLIVDLLLGEEEVSPLCFTVQAEVADRLLAPSGGKDYGPISIYAQALAVGRRISRLSPRAFWPAPQVDSAMVRLDVRADTDRRLKESLARVVHSCFLYRRKTLRWSLRQLVDDSMLEQIGAGECWNLDARPEQLTVEQWVALAASLVDAGRRR